MLSPGTPALGVVLQPAKPAEAKAPRLKSAARRVKAFLGINTSLFTDFATRA
jgi:hypothetical protein